jgi:hypothetical protein
MSDNTHKRPQGKNDGQHDVAEEHPKKLKIDDKDKFLDKRQETTPVIEARPSRITRESVRRLLARDPRRSERAEYIYRSGEIDRCYQEGNKIEARVEGTQRPHYRVTIEFHAQPQSRTFHQRMHTIAKHLHLLPAQVQKI